MPRTWFITGISRGFGQSLAEAALAAGENVVGTTRDGKSPIKPGTGKLEVLTLDVADHASISGVVAAAQKIHGRLDVVVNNAGYGLLGAVEAASEADARRVMEVNYFGTLGVIQAALPFLRAQGSGHIVNFSSIAGLAPMAGAGLYAAAKFAIEGLSQALADEIEPFGLKVTVVEPGAFRTDFLSDHSIRRTKTVDAYAKTVGASMERLGDMAGRQIGDPAKAIEAIRAAVDAARPPLNLVLGSDAWRRNKVRQDRFASDLAAWEKVSLSTDYPK